MILKKASYKAIKYACLKYHYAKSVPVNVFGFAVFNDDKEFCGCIVYGRGANNNIAKPFKMVQGQVIELVRVALNGKQSVTSKAVAISIRLLPKFIPTAKLLVSYADENQGHSGTIYQAMNWFYIGDSETTKTPVMNGKRVHARAIYSRYGTNDIKALQERGIDVHYVKDKPKRKYIYPIDKNLIPMCKELSKEYPKKCVSSLR